MRIAEDDSAFDWIARGRTRTPAREKGVEWAGARVRNLMPDVFEAYAKIFHRLSGRHDHIDNPLDDEEIAILRIPPCARLRSLVEKKRKPEGQTRLRWRTVAELLGIPFVPEITDDWFRLRMDVGCWQRFLYGPGEGSLEDDEYSEIARLFSEAGFEEQCFFRLPEVPFFTVEDQPLLFTGTLPEATAIPTKSNWKWPEYWWSLSLTWCFCSDYDLPFTIVGGPRGLISRILACNVLESIEVFADTRVDSLVPIAES